jgi:putative ABC transport system permease protein
MAQVMVLPGLAWAAGPAARFTTRVLGQKTRRTALTVAMLGVGVGSIVWLRVVGHSFEQSLTAALSAALQGDLVVTSSHVASGYLEAPMHAALRDEVGAVPGVRVAVAERLVDWQLADGPIAIDAFDAAYFSSTEFGRWPLVGASAPRVWEELERGDAVLVSSNFAINLGVAAGDALVLETPQGRLDTVVAGVTVNFSSPRGTIVMSRDLYRRYWRDDQVTRVFLRADGTVPVASVRQAVERDLGRKYGLRVISAAGLIDYFRGEVRRAFAPVDVLGGLVLLVVLVGVADTLGAEVVDRTREVGVIRALGVRRRHLRRMVLCEALVLAGLGLVLALSAGLLLGTLWVEQTFTHLLGWRLEVYVPWSALGAAVATTVAICCLAAVVPARRVSALEPARALRYE